MHLLLLIFVSFCEILSRQHYITEQKSQYLQLRVEMFERVSQRVETRLAAFVEDIKVMQKSLKQDLGDSMSTERDLRRLFEQKDSQSVVAAEKLSFVLESLEKFKVVASERYESSFAQIDKFGVEWELLKTELTQVHIFLQFSLSPSCADFVQAYTCSVFMLFLITNFCIRSISGGRHL